MLSRLTSRTGLELGADDYITKPFSPREVVLRVKAVLRRGQPSEPSDVTIEAGEIRLDAEGHRTWVSGEEVVLTATEFRRPNRDRSYSQPGLFSAPATLQSPAPREAM